MSLYRCGKLFALKSYLNKHLEASCTPCNSTTNEEVDIENEERQKTAKQASKNDDFEANTDEDDEEYIQVI